MIECIRIDRTTITVALPHSKNMHRNLAKCPKCLESKQVGNCATNVGEKLSPRLVDIVIKEANNIAKNARASPSLACTPQIKKYELMRSRC